MSRYGSWVANAALFVLSSFLLADLSNALIAELLTPDAAALATPDGAAALLVKPRRDRGVILSRNLFNVSTLAPPTALVPSPTSEPRPDRADCTLSTS